MTAYNIYTSISIDSITFTGGSSIGEQRLPYYRAMLRKTLLSSEISCYYQNVVSFSFFMIVGIFRSNSYFRFYFGSPIFPTWLNILLDFICSFIKTHAVKTSINLWKRDYLNWMVWSAFKTWLNYEIKLLRKTKLASLS